MSEQTVAARTHAPRFQSFDGLRLVTSPLIHDVSTLFPEERTQIAGAVDKRQREFASGRFCARRALSQLGMPSVPLLRRHDRTPVWPMNAVGSISHCRALAGAVVAFKARYVSLGFDLEDRAPLDTDLWDMVLGHDEREWVERPGALEPRERAKLIFSAKEAVYKCQHPILRLPLDFKDVRVLLNEATSTFEAHLIGQGLTAWNRVEGSYAVDSSTIRTLTVIPSGTTGQSR